MERSRGYTPMQKRVLLAGSIGQMIDFYDFTLYGLTAVILAKHFFPSLNPLISLLTLFATYGVAFFIRPIGGLFFGALGDRIGRRKVLVITLMSVGLATTLMGVLPTYAQIGIFSPLLLVLLRLVQGFATGGESVGAPAFVFEHAPSHRRGFFINITIAAVALSAAIASLLILLLNALMTDENYVSWGWRIPFLLALPLSLFGLWIRQRTEESEVFRENQEVRATQVEEFRPIKQALDKNLKQIIQGFCVIGLAALCFYSIAGYFPTYIQVAANLSRSASMLVTAAILILCTILLPLFGLLGDRVGRRPMLICGALMLTIVTIPAFMLVTTGELILALLGMALFVLSYSIYAGGAYTFVVEVFSVDTRLTSVAMSYNVSQAFFGGTAPFISTALVGFTSYAFSPGIYIAAIGLLSLLVILLTDIPETRHFYH